MIEMCPMTTCGHTDYKKCVCITPYFFEVLVQEWTFYNQVVYFLFKLLVTNITSLTIQIYIISTYFILRYTRCGEYANGINKKKRLFDKTLFIYSIKSTEMRIFQKSKNNAGIAVIGNSNSR